MSMLNAPHPRRYIKMFISTLLPNEDYLYNQPSPAEKGDRYAVDEEIAI